MSVMTKPKPKAGRPRKFKTATKDQGQQADSAERSGKSVHVYLDPEVMDALERFLATFDFPPKKTDVLERSLREYLQAQGHWPPKGQAL